MYLLLGSSFTIESSLHISLILSYSLFELNRRGLIATVLFMHLIELANVFLGGLFELIYELFDFRLVFIDLLLHDCLA